MWDEGNIKIQNSIIHYWVKHFDEPSIYGIQEGRISKLTLKQNGEFVANFDRGWDIEPTNADAETALALLLKQYN